MARTGTAWGWLAALALAGSGAARAVPPRALDADDYQDRLRAMWLGCAIANWTGLRTEGVKQGPPFYTDADWGSGGWIVFVLSQDPWLADDDTDIEAAYLAMALDAGSARLTGQQITQGWIEHVNRFIWVSNQAARTLMDRGVGPPGTSMPCTNAQRLMIDAQLTTELFGAMAPGMPERALELADLPIAVTARGHAAHAAQFYAVLYSLATQADPALSGRDKALWLCGRAGEYLPGESKASDIVAFVLADYLANPDVNDWERTRDRIYERYQRDAGLHGFVYRAWYESSVNFACGVMALLYGECDYRRTVQIATLSGWDSDNATATLGGLLGLMLGHDALAGQFPGQAFSDRFDIARTRDAMVDYLPGDPAAQDTFEMMAQRLIPLVRDQVLEEGGVVEGDRWLLAPARGGSPLSWNPRHADDQRSATNQVRRAGGVVVASSSTSSTGSWGTGSPDVARIADGLETAHRGLEEPAGVVLAYSSLGGVPPAGTSITLGVSYDRGVMISGIRFVEGDHFSNANVQGGYYEGLLFEALVGGAWVAPAGHASEALDAGRPFQTIDWVLDAPLAGVEGVRVRGLAGGASRFVTCAELDAVLEVASPAATGFDLTGDGVVDLEDLHGWEGSPVDLDGDGSAGEMDRVYLLARLRWSEPGGLVDGRE